MKKMVEVDVQVQAIYFNPTLKSLVDLLRLSPQTPSFSMGQSQCVSHLFVTNGNRKWRQTVCINQWSLT